MATWDGVIYKAAVTSSAVQSGASSEEAENLGFIENHPTLFTAVDLF